MDSFAHVTHFFLFTAFLLLLLVSLSTPIIKSLDLMKLDVNVGGSFLGVHDTVRFGVWGLCLGNAKSSVVGMQSVNSDHCTKAKLGYSSNFAVNSNVVNVIVKGLTFALVLHPLATGFAFLSLLLSLAISFTHPSFSSRLASLLTLSATIIAALLSTVVFIIDVVLVTDAKRKASKDTGGSVLKVSFGPGVWMVLVAALLLWAATVGSLAGIFAWGPFRRRTFVNSRKTGKY